jgi:hypothetical protein
MDESRRLVMMRIIVFTVFDACPKERNPGSIHY